MSNWFVHNNWAHNSLLFNFTQFSIDPLNNLTALPSQFNFTQFNIDPLTKLTALPSQFHFTQFNIDPLTKPTALHSHHSCFPATKCRSDFPSSSWTNNKSHWTAVRSLAVLQHKTIHSFFFFSFNLLIGWQLSIWICCSPFSSSLYNY